MDELDALKKKYNLQDFAEHKLGIKRKKGNQFHCFTKNHKNGDKNPSLLIEDDHFKCMGASCGIKGDIIELVKAHRQCDFKAALEFLQPGSLRQISFKKEKPKLSLEKILNNRKFSASADYLSFMETFWDILKGSSLSPNAQRWLNSRSIDQSVAYELGCREVSAKKHELIEFMKGFDLKGVGFSKDDKKNGLKVWYPLKNFSNDNILFPCFHPKFHFPVQWRSRLFRPWYIKGSLIKIVAQYNLTNGMIPLGLARKPYRDIVIICEGEPDYLSFADAGRKITKEHGYQVDVIGLCAVNQGWSHSWTSVLKDAAYILIAVHDQAAGKQLAAQLVKSYALSYGMEKAKYHIFRRLLDEENDANDLHKKGLLTDFIKESIKGGL